MTSTRLFPRESFMPGSLLPVFALSVAVTALSPLSQPLCQDACRIPQRRMVRATDVCVARPKIVLSQRRAHSARVAMVEAEAYRVAKPKVVSGFLTRRVAALLVLTIGGFTALFSTIEGWQVVDALYFTTTILTTIGFGDLKPTCAVTCALTALLGCLGVGLLGGLVSAVLGAYLDDQQPYIDQQLNGKGDGDGDGQAGNKAVRMHASCLRWSAVPIWAQLTLLIGVGTVGTFVCERNLGWAKALYLAVSTTTTAGLGDVTATTNAAKIFFSLYAPLAVVFFARVVGRLALRPLELARRSAQAAVLKAYGIVLTEATFLDVARGPLVKQLGLSADDAICTRDEFTLLTLVKQGKITPQDLAECRSTFTKLDGTGSGKLSIEDLELVELIRSY